MKKKENPITSNEILDMIRNRYAGDGYVVLSEVPDATGFIQNRWIDAAVFSLWPSKGLTRIAFEIKVSRSDFIRELQNRAKRQWAEESFHEFWFAGPAECFQADEIPKNCGLMVARGNKLVIKKHCVRNDKPKLTDELLAAFMRAAWKGMKAENKRAMDVSPEYQRAKLYEKAVSAFCSSRSVYLNHALTEAAIVESLETATMDKSLKAEREHILGVLRSFQDRMAALFEIFAQIAARSILERDELGEHIVRAYGGKDEDSLESIKVLLKHPKKQEWRRRTFEMINLMMSWQQLQEK